MRSLIDLSSWQGTLSTLAGLVLVTLIAVGIRLLVMQRVQQRRERQNRQINERLKTLIAAYKILGGSFTGNLAVDPSHLRDARLRAEAQSQGLPGPAPPHRPPSERRRRVRDAVEAALSDIVLLGTAEQVRLAAQAANDMVAGRKIETDALVQSLRDFIREVLDLDPLAADLRIPKQGPVRTGGPTGRGSAANAGGRGGKAGGGESGGAGGGASSGAGGGAGLAVGGMLGLGVDRSAADVDPLPGAEARQP